LFDEELGWRKLTGAGLIISANIMVVLLHKKSEKQGEKQSEKQDSLKEDKS
jgi:hypothetical protein